MALALRRMFQPGARRVEQSPAAQGTTPAAQPATTIGRNAPSGPVAGQATAATPQAPAAAPVTAGHPAEARVPATASAGRRRPGFTRVAAARGAWAIGSVMLTIARIVRLIASVIAALIVLAIVLRLLGANGSNAIVRDIHDAGGWFSGPFKGIFKPHSAKVGMAINWGIAAVVYLIVGGAIAGFIARLAPRGVSPREPVV